MMVITKHHVTFFFALVLCMGSGVSALKCFVGEGNSSIPLPATDVAQEQYEEEQNRESVFEIRECGERYSQLLSIEKIAKNVSDQIQKGISGILERAKDLTGGRRKREEDSKYACLKVVLGQTAYRSCVQKVSDIAMNCTGGSNLAVCYCHFDNCNSAWQGRGSGLVWLMSIGTAAMMILLRI